MWFRVPVSKVFVITTWMTGVLHVLSISSKSAPFLRSATASCIPYRRRSITDRSIRRHPTHMSLAGQFGIEKSKGLLGPQWFPVTSKLTPSQHFVNASFCRRIRWSVSEPVCNSWCSANSVSQSPVIKLSVMAGLVYKSCIFYELIVLIIVKMLCKTLWNKKKK